MAFTPDEKCRIRSHLGYPNVGQVATFALGIPLAMEPMFMVEAAMNLELPPNENHVRQTLKRMDRIEDQIDENADALLLKQADEVVFREDEFEKLVQRYKYWQGKLANALGLAGGNPFDARFFMNGTIASLNVAVAH
jgi:hypothetical protein